MLNQTGAVVIGRNEGDRLIESLRSIIRYVNKIVYVDSGSSDGSVEQARSIGVEVVELDMSIPFTAARGRNTGFSKLMESFPDLKYVHFFDGDCTVVDGWFQEALDEIEKHEKVAVVFGRRREAFPEKTIYNRLTDMEWQNKPGFVYSCGGDALFKTRAFIEAGGYDDSLIAGEEPELCLRLRKKGWKILSIDHEMTTHDANIIHFSQWWKRCVRCGHAYFEGFMMHGSSSEGYRRKQVKSIFIWTILLPVVSIGTAPYSYGFSLFLLSGYGLLWFRIRKWRLMMNNTSRLASLYAFATVLGKFAELQGIFQYLANKILGKKSKIIEYKKS